MIGTAAEATVVAFNEAINARDLAALGRLMDERHQFIDSAGATVMGKAACLEAWRGFFEAFPDYRNVFDDVRGDAAGVVDVRGRSECSEPALAGPAHWRAVMRDGLLLSWHVTDDPDFETRWAVPAYLDHVHPPVTEDAVAEAEALLGVKLPPTYLRMVEQQNGGYMRATWPDLPHRRVDGIGSDFPSITHEPWWREEGAEDEMWVPRAPELLVSFDGEGHWDLCLDYRDSGPTGEPAVTYVDVDSEEDTTIAHSFASFLAGLVDRVATGAIRVYADVAIDDFATLLGEVLGQDVIDQGSWNDGYPVFRAAVGEPNGWVWISPNRVPAGFRRDGDQVLTTEETRLRVPADPTCTLLVSCTPEGRDEVRRALQTVTA